MTLLSVKVLTRYKHMYSFNYLQLFLKETLTSMVRPLCSKNEFSKRNPEMIWKMSERRTLMKSK